MRAQWRVLGHGSGVLPNRRVTGVSRRQYRVHAWHPVITVPAVTIVSDLDGPAADGELAVSAAKLEFDVLTDLHLRVAEAFGLAFTLPADLKELYAASRKACTSGPTISGCSRCGKWAALSTISTRDPISRRWNSSA
jgi:hypothetical protein